MGNRFHEDDQKNKVLVEINRHYINDVLVSVTRKYADGTVIEKTSDFDYGDYDFDDEDWDENNYNLDEDSKEDAEDDDLDDFKVFDADENLERVVRSYDLNNVLVKVTRYYKDGTVDVKTEDFDDLDYLGGLVVRSSHSARIGSETQAKRLERVFQKLAKQARFAGTCHLVDEIGGEDMQACAIKVSGEDQVWVTKHMANASNDDQLAFIIAHEIAHHLHDDHANMKQEVTESFDKVINELEEMDEEMVGRGRGVLRRGVVIVGSGLFKLAAASRQLKKTSRDNENNADAAAIDLMTKAGFDPSEAENFLRTFYGGRLPDIGYYNTVNSGHLNPAERGARVRRLAEEKKRRR